MKNKTIFKSGDKFKITIELDAEVLTDLDSGVTKEQLIDIIYSDNAYGLKSVISGSISGELENQIDIVWDKTFIDIN